ncbi:MAG: hypothetical protein ACW99J_20280 [Candidatus Thorarchaeota archaeon]|jgi:hypothetical protein
MEIVRTDEEIREVLEKCMELEESGENPYWGMTYTQGVQFAIDWLTEEGQDHPFDE